MLKDVAFARKIARERLAPVVHDVPLGQTKVKMLAEIATLLNRGYQMFLETPSGRKIPATATELKALHEFEEDVRAALGMVDLYNTALGTTSPKHEYDRVFKRDTGDQPKPWESKNNRIVPPETKGSMHL